MRYVEAAPVPALAPFVACLWTLEGHANVLGGEPQRILPDGRPELVLHFGDAFERVDDVQRTRQPAVLFAGQLTSQLVLHPTGHIRVLGIRFQPHGAAVLLRTPQERLAGRTMALDELAPSVARSFVQIRDGASTLPEAAALAQQALLRLVEPHRIDRRITHVVSAIGSRHGRVSIDRLAADTGMTRRHLERQFLRHVGVSPKRLARIARFQRALRVLEDPGDPGPRGAVTAAACGYADQAHFVRDFRDLAGCPPTEHLLSRGLLTGFFTSGTSGTTGTSGARNELARTHLF